MCGISGIINLNNQPVQEQELLSMMVAMNHRGPDDQGIFIDKNVGFGFVRLSIIDLSYAGHQPFQSEDKRFTLVFNGEIYNYIELREELITKGVIFKTKTDTEALLKSYIFWGESCLHKFNGMWAFAIYDNQEKRVFFARDRFGVKPFYYYHDENIFYFASEITSILSVLKEKPKANEQNIFDFLVFNKTEHTENTFFEGIKKLMHGCSAVFDLNSLTLKYHHKWYNIVDKIKSAKGFENAREFKESFIDAIKLRLRSDVPVGVCLSGGLDSSAIVSTIYTELKNEDIKTFSAIFNNNFIYDEKKYIDIYSYLGRNNFVTPTSTSLLKDLDKFISLHAEPFPGTSIYAQYKVMELAKGKVVVTLDGQGADEILAGYHDFYSYYFKGLILNGNLIKFLKESIYYFKIHKSIFSFKILFFLLTPKKIKSKLLKSNANFINSEFITRYKDSSNVIEKLYNSKDLKEALINHVDNKLENLLKWSDLNSMYFSIESRVPFLDYRLVEKTLATKNNLIINRGVTKSILREAMKGVLPEVIRTRQDKIGFATPQDEWFRTEEWKIKINDLLNSEHMKKRKYFDINYLQSMYIDHLNNKINAGKDLWKCIHLELWLRKYID